jgi:hypothetical protein
MNKTIVIAVVVALVLGGFIGYALAPKSASLGAANVTPYNAMNNQSLVNELNLIANPLVAIIAGSGSFGNTTLGALGTSTSTATLNVSTPGAALGDMCESGLASATSSVISTNCSISSAGTSTVTVFNSANSATNVATGTVNVRVFPNASFNAPVGL